MNRRTFMTGLPALGAALAAPFRAKAAGRERIAATFQTRAVVLNEHWMAGIEDVELAYRHGGGCEGIAFRMRRVPAPGERVLSADFMHLDGTPCKTEEIPLCGRCGRRILGWRREDIGVVERDQNDPFGHWAPLSAQLAHGRG